MLLDPMQDGQLVGSKAQPIEASPTDYDYGSANPFIERTWDVDHLDAGFGEIIQGKGPTGRYKYAENVDMSMDAAILGPLFHPETVLATGADKTGRYLIRGLASGVDVLYALVGNQVRQRVADNNWTTAFTCAGSAVPQQAVRFKFAGAGAFDGLFVGVSTGNLVYFDGTTWAQLAAGVGPPEDRCQFVERVGDELWAAWGNKISKCEGDPRVRANWSGPITIGDASQPITWLRQNRNELYIFKANGVYTVSTAGLDQDLMPGLRVVPSVENGRNAAVWLDYIWVPFGGSFFKLAPGAQFKPVGTERLFKNTTPVAGRITCFTGHNTWFGYEGLWNQSANTSHLLKYGTWIESEDGRLTDFVQFRDVHNGALASWPGKKMTFIDVAYMPNDNERLYCLFDDGTLAWCYLPRGGPNPVADPNVEFNTSPGYLYWPTFHGGYQADPKAVRGFSVYGTVDTIAHAEIEYRTDPSARWEPLADDDGATAKFTIGGQRIDVPIDLLVAGRAIEARTKLTNATDKTRTPQISGQAIHAAVRPSVRLEYQLRPKARNFLVRRDGVIARRRAAQVRQACEDAVKAVGTVEVVFPWQETAKVNFVDITETYRATGKSYGEEWDITLTGVEYRTMTTPGSTTTIATMTYGTMEQYTYAELESLL